MRIRFYISLSLLILLACGACGGSSEFEMKEAQRAMDKAKDLHADDLAHTDFQQAQKAWDRAQAAQKEGKTGAAKVLFSSAKNFFGKAADIAKAKSDALTRELSAMQLMISKNYDQVQSDLSMNHLSPKQQDRVRAIALEIEAGKASIGKMVAEEDLRQAVATAKDVQTKVYNAQLILAGQSPSKQRQPVQ
jgi:hypothetical protein